MSELFFNCPSCSQEIEAPDDMAGVAINCPSCAIILRVPGEPRATAEFLFTCPSCGQSIDAPVDAAGLKLKCPGCEADLTIPDPPPPDPEPVEDDATFTSDMVVGEEEQKGSTARIDLPEGDSVPPPQMRTILIKRNGGVQRGQVSRVPKPPPGGDSEDGKSKTRGIFGWLKR
jgi:DNA-directed RNA polymerase subunit RPC12/RpoP